MNNSELVIALQDLLRRFTVAEILRALAEIMDD